MNYNKNLKKNFISFLHPICFSIFPLFFLYTRNAGEMMFKDILFPILFTVCFAIFITFFFGILLRNYHKSSIIASLIIFLFYSFGRVVRFLPHYQIIFKKVTIETEHLFLFFWVFITIFGIIKILLIKKDLTNPIKILNFIGVILVFIQIVQTSTIFISHIHIVKKYNTKIDYEKKEDKYLPDLYYIVLDGYGGKDTLRNIYGIDNTDFLTFLKEKKFYVPEKNYTNYCQTLFSLGSTMNLDYIDKLGDFPKDMKDRIVFSKILQNNKIMKFFKEAGYNIVSFASGYTYTEIEDVDLYIKPTGAISEFQNVLMTTTILPYTKKKNNSQFSQHRKRITFILNKLSRINEVESPIFVFAHVICPHPPFVFKSDGQPIQQSNYFHYSDGSHFLHSKGGNYKDYIEGYSNQIVYLNKLLKITIDEILKKYSGNLPIIILQADHGPGSNLNWESLKNTNILERFSILSAYYFPGFEDSIEFEEISPVNLFRVILNTYFNMDFEILTHRSFFNHWSKPYDFIDVTSTVFPHLVLD